MSPYAINFQLARAKYSILIITLPMARAPNGSLLNTVRGFFFRFRCAELDMQVISRVIKSIAFERECGGGC
jgi:hypothetical protein